jgi:hypothetical protein
MQMSSTRASLAQLFFDSGRGFNEQDSSVVPVYSRDLHDFNTLRFDLPRRTLTALRFDPLTTEGSFIIRDVTVTEGARSILRFGPPDLIPLNQIASHQTFSNGAVFSTTSKANDPGLTLRLRAPIALRRIVILEDVRRLIALWIGLALLGFVVTRPVFLPLRNATDSALDRAWSLFERGSQQFSNDFLQLDASAMAFYTACVLVFLGASLADLNGSSISLYHSAYHRGAYQKPLVGEPRTLRSDEWAYVTPDILNQSQRADRFAAWDSALGNHFVSLTGNIPVRHFSTAFRPQFWSFFVLPVDYAFAIYWQFKWFLLVTGVFTWLLLITRSTLWAAAGSLWYFFSPFTQWSLSWPSALAEMIGLLCWTVVFACYLTLGRQKLTLFFAAICTACCAINFALCAYPPHLIPLCWLAVFFFSGWCLSNWHTITHRDAAWPRLLAGLLALALIGITGLLVFLDLKPAIRIISDTVYPGKRLYAAGTFKLATLGSHFLQWNETEQHFPVAIGNMCEGSGFLWLAPVTLLSLGRITLSRVQKFALISLWLTFALLLAWLLLPFPASLASVLALNRTAAARVLPALGLANVAILALCVSAPRAVGKHPSDISRQIGVTVLAGLVFFFLFRATNHALGSFFSTHYLVLAAVFTGFLVSLVLHGSSRILAALLVTSQTIVFGTVNPVMHGLGVITESNLYNFVRKHPDLLLGKWVVFSDSVVNSGFVAATGCNVYTGTRYLPDVDHFSTFAANGIDTTRLNRLGFLDAHLRQRNERLQVDVPQTVIMRLDVSPNDPLLREIGIRYVAVDSRPPDTAVTGLVPLSPTPIDGFWLYRLP